jgi:hypothetical protein
MKVGFIHCQLKGCKNITKDLYKEEYGAYCFLHTKYISPFQYLEISMSNRIASPGSPVSSRRIPLSSMIETENFEKNEPIVNSLKPVSSSKYKIPSPKSKSVYIPKMECGICKDLYEQTNVMECGHLICPNDLKDLRSPYCPFCNQEMRGPFVTEEVMQIIQDKYKQDIAEKGNKYKEGDED